MMKHEQHWCVLKVEVAISFQGMKQAVNLLLKLCPKDPRSSRSLTRRKPFQPSGEYGEVSEKRERGKGLALCSFFF